MSSDSNKSIKEKQAPPQTTTVLLVRHGQNDWVGKHKLAGWTPGVHLNKHGQKQAKAVGKKLAKSNRKIDFVYASPLERTMETAQLITKYLNLHVNNLPIKKCKGLGEVDYGKWTGEKIKKLSQDPHWPVIQFYPSNARFPAGESMYEMQTRAVKEVNRLVAKHAGKTLLLVSHADLIKSVVAHYLGIHFDLFQRIVISPASITTIVFTFMRPMVYTVNDVSALPPEPDQAKNNKKS